MVPFAQSRLDLNDAELGLILLMFGVGALITMPLTGWLVQRFGSRNIVAVGACGMIVILPLLTLASTALTLTFFLFLFGASNGALNVSINSHAVLVESKSPKPLMSGFHCLFSLGGLLGAGFVSIFLELGFGLFSCAVLVSAVMMLILLTKFRHLLPSCDDVRVDSQNKFTMPSGKVLFLAVLCFIAFLAEGAVLDWSAVFLLSNRDYDLSIAGIGYAAFSIAMSFGRLVGDRLTQRLGPVIMVQMGALLAASGYLIAVTISWGYFELLGFVMIGLGASNVVPVLFSTAGRQPKTSPSQALTAMTTLGYTGLLAGPAIIGFVAQATTLSLALSGIAILLLIVSFNGRIVQPAARAIIEKNVF